MSKVMLNGVELSPDGSYSYQGEAAGYKGHVDEYKDIVAVQFNRLRGKLFNLVEASIDDEARQKATKGLVKGFCDQAFGDIAADMGGLLQRIGFEMEKEIIFRSDPVDKQIEEQSKPMEIL